MSHFTPGCQPTHQNPSFCDIWSRAAQSAFLGFISEKNCYFMLALTVMRQANRTDYKIYDITLISYNKPLEQQRLMIYFVSFSIFLNTDDLIIPAYASETLLRKIFLLSISICTILFRCYDDNVMNMPHMFFSYSNSLYCVWFTCHWEWVPAYQH